MATGMEVVIQAPKPVKRPWGLLLDMAPSLGLAGERWRAGIKFPSYGSGGMQRAADQFCIDPDNLENLDANPVGGAPVVFSSFTVFASEACSALDIDYAWLAGRLDDRIAVMASEQVAAELAQGGATGSSPTLHSSSSVIAGGPAPINDVLGRCEAHLAAKLHGGVGMIHLTPAALANLQIRGSLALVDGQWRTPTGHYVVADAGYLGTHPNGQSDTAGREWAYASGLVSVQIGPYSDLDETTGGNLDRTRNIFTGREVATAVLAFDPATAGAIQFVFPIDVE